MLALLRSAVELPRLMLITDSELAGAELLTRTLECVRRAAPGSVIVQLRDRQLGVAARLELGRRLRELTAEHSQYLVVNERVDLALLCQADGVHLPEIALPAAEVRRFAPELWLSAACHVATAETPPVQAGSVAQAAGFESLNVTPSVDALVLSPVLSPRKGRPALGLSGLAHAAQSLGRPVYALGGVDATGARACLQAGACGVALIGAVYGGAGRVEPLLAALGVLRA